MQRVEDIQRLRCDAKDAALTSIQKKRIQALRKLGKTREQTEKRVRVFIGVVWRDTVRIVCEWCGVGQDSATRLCCNVLLLWRDLVLVVCVPALVDRRVDWHWLRCGVGPHAQGRHTSRCHRRLLNIRLAGVCAAGA